MIGSTKVRLSDAVKPVDQLPVSIAVLQCTLGCDTAIERWREDADEAGERWDDL